MTVKLDNVRIVYKRDAPGPIHAAAAEFGASLPPFALCRESIVGFRNTERVMGKPGFWEQMCPTCISVMDDMEEDLSEE